MKCPICKAPMIEEELDYVLQLEDSAEMRLEGVPTWVCEVCDHTLVEEDVTEAVNDMLSHMDTFSRGGEEE